MQKHKYTGKDKLNYNYKGLNIHAAEGIHEFTMNYINDNFNKDIKILILGAGTGAFDCRLYDNGFSKIDSADINFQNYKYKNNTINFIKLDLNNNFSEKLEEKYDLVIGLEIIEHLNSPFDFLKNIKKILEKKGDIIITTPNLHSYNSRIINLLLGNPKYFYGKPLPFEHISPILIGVMQRYSEILNLDLCHYKAISDTPVVKGNLFRFFIFWIKFHLKILDIFSKNNIIRKISNGNILVFFLKNK